jgi:hypothetical protein
MTAKIIKKARKSKLWGALAGKENQGAITRALESTQLSITEEDIKTIVGEVYLQPGILRRALKR